MQALVKGSLVFRIAYLAAALSASISAVADEGFAIKSFKVGMSVSDIRGLYREVFGCKTKGRSECSAVTPRNYEDERLRVVGVRIKHAVFVLYDGRVESLQLVMPVSALSDLAAGLEERYGPPSSREASVRSWRKSGQQLDLVQQGAQAGIFIRTDRAITDELAQDAARKRDM